MIEWLTNPCIFFMLLVHALFAYAAWTGSVQRAPRSLGEGVPGFVAQAAMAGVYPTVILAFPLLALREAVLERYPLLPAGSALGAALWLYAACFGATLLYLTRRSEEVPVEPSDDALTRVEGVPPPR